MDLVFFAFLRLMIEVISLYNFLLLSYVIINILESFGIVNKYNNFVYTVHNFLFGITEPLLRPIRRIIPHISGFDLSPLVLFFIIFFLKTLLIGLAERFPS